MTESDTMRIPAKKKAKRITISLTPDAAEKARKAAEKRINPAVSTKANVSAYIAELIWADSNTGRTA
jgi:hypothetical protein